MEAHRNQLLEQAWKVHTLVARGPQIGEPIEFTLYDNANGQRARALASPLKHTVPPPFLMQPFIVQGHPGAQYHTWWLGLTDMKTSGRLANRQTLAARHQHRGNVCPACALRLPGALLFY